MVCLSMTTNTASESTNNTEESEWESGKAQILFKNARQGKPQRKHQMKMNRNRKKSHFLYH